MTQWKNAATHLEHDRWMDFGELLSSSCQTNGSQLDFEQKLNFLFSVYNKY